MQRNQDDIVRSRFAKLKTKYVNFNQSLVDSQGRVLNTWAGIMQCRPIHKYVRMRHRAAPNDPFFPLMTHLWRSNNVIHPTLVPAAPTPRKIDDLASHFAPAAAPAAGST
jgi:hypothetical protein